MPTVGIAWNVPLNHSGSRLVSPLAAFALLAFSTALLAQPPFPPPQGAAPQSPAPQGRAQGAPTQPNGAGGPVDEPGRGVARLGILNGDASIRRGDASEWQAAAVNAPLMSGDEISVGVGSRVEVQFDAAHFARIAGDSEVRLADLENGHYQVQISHGLVTWRVLRDLQAQAESDTPLVAVHPGRQSQVRVEVAADGTTHITVRKGEATVSTPKGSETVAEGSTMDVRGSLNDPEFQVVAAAAKDEWDNWSDQRDSYLARAQAPRYVQQDVYGVEDLDPYGHWVYDPAYGWVWMPTVAASWAPYQDGQWVWEDYYGWTWVDYAPWGWAPFHYGSWYSRGALGWAWYPGPRIGRVWWRPAMVGFFGWGGGVGVGIGFGFGNIGWIPLAPFEVFHPWYGRGGFGGALINVNIARNTNIVGAFRNAGVAHGVTAVTAADFQRGSFRNTIAVDRATLQQASLVRGAVPVTPTARNLAFTNRAATVTTRATATSASTRFAGSPAAAATRTPFAQQQAAVRSAVTGQGRTATALQGRSEAQSQTSAQGRAASTPSAAGQSQSSSGWQRFQSTPSSSNSSVGNSRTSTPGSTAAPGFSRFGSTPNESSQFGGQQARPQGSAGSQAGQSAQPRQYQVSPQITRQRPEYAPAAPQSSGSGASQGRAQSPPAPSPGGSAPRSAPAGGGRQSGASQRGGRR